MGASALIWVKFPVHPFTLWLKGNEEARTKTDSLGLPVNGLSTEKAKRVKAEGEKTFRYSRSLSRGVNLLSVVSFFHSNGSNQTGTQVTLEQIPKRPPEIPRSIQLFWGALERWVWNIDGDYPLPNNSHPSCSRLGDTATSRATLIVYLIMTDEQLRFRFFDTSSTSLWLFRDHRPSWKFHYFPLFSLWFLHPIPSPPIPSDLIVPLTSPLDQTTHQLMPSWWEKLILRWLGLRLLIKLLLSVLY